jgi:hypothetical protein
MNQYKRIEIKGTLTITTTQEDREALKAGLLTAIRQALNRYNEKIDPGTVVDFELKSITELPF